MRQITHILKDGTEIEDISGYVIKEKEFKSLYKYLSKIIVKETRENDDKNSTRTIREQ